MQTRHEHPPELSELERVRRLLARARQRQLEAAIAGRFDASARHAERAERLRDVECRCETWRRLPAV